jgi:hypothetical protein
MPIAHRPASGRSAAIAAVLATVLAGAMTAAEPAARVSTPTLTREELIRKWDLNSDGKIDTGEAEIAASRMRRERAEMRLNSGIDPVTGRPRGEAPPAAEPQPDPDELAEDLFGPKEEPADGEEPDDDAAPGTRVPRPTLPERKLSDRQRAGERKPAAPAPKRQPITGGVRGGGVAARPGHGDGTKAAPLNAGRPLVTTGPVPGRSGRPGMAVRGPVTGKPQEPAGNERRGGLVPQVRPPSRPPRSTDLFDPY